MTRKPEDRVDRIVSRLIHGKRLELRGGDAEEKEAIIAAARLAAVRHGPQRMSPAFRKRLAGALALAPADAWLTRRAALVAGLGLVAGAATGAMIGRNMAAAAPRAGAPVAPATGPIEPMNGRWIDVAALTDLVEGHGQRISAGKFGAYLFRHGDSVTAVSSICTHLPCELQWDDGSALLDCPCHPVSFTPDGRSTNYTTPLPSLNPVHVRVTAAGRVEVLGTA